MAFPAPCAGTRSVDGVVVISPHPTSGTVSATDGDEATVSVLFTAAQPCQLSGRSSVNGPDTRFIYNVFVNYARLGSCPSRSSRNASATLVSCDRLVGNRSYRQRESRGVVSKAQVST